MSATAASLSEGKHHPLIVASTGAGKTRCFLELVKFFIERKPDLRILFMVNRLTLVEQLEGNMKKLGMGVGVVSGGLGRREWDHQMTIASYLSIINLPPEIYNVVVWDEAHRFAPHLDDKASPLRKWFALLKERSPNVKSIGFTATPFTTSGLIYGEEKHFPEITYEVGMKRLLQDRFLVPLVAKGGKEGTKFNLKGVATKAGDWAQDQLAKLADNSELVSEQVKDALRHLADCERKCVVWQCVNISHCEAVAKELQEAGERAGVVHSEQEDLLFDESIEAFRAGKVRHLVFVSIISEGFDFPPIDAVVILRPTKSPVLYVQSVGRALRPSPGKSDALLLDYGHVVKHCGPIDFPYIRQAEQELREGKRVFSAKLEELKEKTIECIACGHFIFGETLHLDLMCPECGANVWEQHKRDVRDALAKKAAKYDSVYSGVSVEVIDRMIVKTRASQDAKSCDVTFLYHTSRGIVSELLSVSPFTGRYDIIRMGQLAKLKKRLRTLGVVSTDDDVWKVFFEMHEKMVKMPYAIITDGKKVFDVHGVQPLRGAKEDDTCADIPLNLSAVQTIFNL